MVIVRNNTHATHSHIGKNKQFFFSGPLMAHPDSWAFVPLPPESGNGYAVVSPEVAAHPPLCLATGCQRRVYPPFPHGVRCELCSAVEELRVAALSLDRETIVAEAIADATLVLARLARDSAEVEEDAVLANVALG